MMTNIARKLKMRISLRTDHMKSHCSYKWSCPGMRTTTTQRDLWARWRWWNTLLFYPCCFCWRNSRWSFKTSWAMKSGWGWLSPEGQMGWSDLMRCTARLKISKQNVLYGKVNVSHVLCCESCRQERWTYLHWSSGNKTNVDVLIRTYRTHPSCGFLCWLSLISSGDWL